MGFNDPTVNQKYEVGAGHTVLGQMPSQQPPLLQRVVTIEQSLEAVGKAFDVCFPDSTRLN